MKTNYIYSICMLIFLCACKKDEDTPIPPRFAYQAPTCVIADYTNSAGGKFSFTYDSQKRLTRLSTNNDSLVRTIGYFEATIQEVITYKTSSATYTYIFRHYVGEDGLIDSTIEQDGYPVYTTQYFYSRDGFLQKVLDISPEGYLYGGHCYKYDGENKTVDYKLNIDGWGRIADSTIEATYTYYPDIRGWLEEWTAWTNRTGRANANAVKSIQSGGVTQTYKYTLGPNQLPTQIEISTPSNVESFYINWTCN